MRSSSACALKDWKTKIITIITTGKGNSGRELRVAGIDEKGNTGYYYKKIFEITPISVDKNVNILSMGITTFLDIINNPGKNWYGPDIIIFAIS